MGYGIQCPRGMSNILLMCLLIGLPCGYSEPSLPKAAQAAETDATLLGPPDASHAKQGEHEQLPSTYAVQMNTFASKHREASWAGTEQQQSKQ